MNKHFLFTLYTIFGFLLLVAPVSASANFFYFDTERSDQQQFMASELIVKSAVDMTEVEVGGANLAAAFGFMVNTSASSIASKFDLAVTNHSSTSGFCSRLTLESTTPDAAGVSSLTAFNTMPLEAYGTFDLLVTSDVLLPIESGQSCTFTVTITAWQANMNRDTAGFRDTTEHTLVVTAAEVIAPAVVPDAAPAPAPAAPFVVKVIDSADTEPALVAGKKELVEPAAKTPVESEPAAKTPVESEPAENTPEEPKSPPVTEDPELRKESPSAPESAAQELPEIRVKEEEEPVPPESEAVVAEQKPPAVKEEPAVEPEVTEPAE